MLILIGRNNIDVNDLFPTISEADVELCTSQTLKEPLIIPWVVFLTSKGQVWKSEGGPGLTYFWEGSASAGDTVFSTSLYYCCESYSFFNFLDTYGIFVFRGFTGGMLIFDIQTNIFHYFFRYFLWPHSYTCFRKAWDLWNSDSTKNSF